MQDTPPQTIHLLTPPLNQQKQVLFQNALSTHAALVTDSIDQTEIIRNAANLAITQSSPIQDTLHSDGQFIVASQMLLPHSLNADTIAVEPIELRSPDIKQNLAEYEALMLTSSQNKQNQPIQMAQTQIEQSKFSYYIGDDDSHSNEQQEIPSSDSDDIFGDIQEQQDQNLYLEQDELDSDDQQDSEDEYPEDYDSEQDSQIQKLFTSTDHPSKPQNQAQFLKRYQQVKHDLQTQQLVLKQQQMIFGGIMPQDMQMRKIKVSQCLLSLINNNYVKRLKIELARRNKMLQQQDTSCLKVVQAELTQNSEYESPITPKQTQIAKPTKKVMFLDNIQAKVYKNDQQVNNINQTQEINEILNGTEKTNRKFITIIPPKKQPIKMHRSCEEIIAKIERQIKQNSNRQAQNQNVVIVCQQTGGNQLNEDLKSNDTNSSEQVLDQRVESAATQQEKQQITPIFNDIIVQECRQATAQTSQPPSAYFTEGTGQDLSVK